MWFVTRPDALSVLKDSKARRALHRYFQVMNNRLPAKFMLARRLSADFDEGQELDVLWRKHEKAYREFRELEKKTDGGEVDAWCLKEPERSFLDLKRTIAERVLEACTFCERRCGVNRLAGELGWCKSGDQMEVSTMFTHMGEEPELVPSFTVFTIGCTMKCLHCQNWSISQRFESGTRMTIPEIANKTDKVRERGARNLNMVGGDPTSWLHNWLSVAKSLRENIPLVWNSNSYYSDETARLLQGLVDVYLLDFKYGNDRCAVRLSRAPWYRRAATRAHLLAVESGELIVRVLVLPDHLECCYRPIVEWISKNLGSMTRVNIMWQYRPEWRAYEIAELGRRLDRREMEETISIAKEAKLENFIT